MVALAPTARVSSLVGAAVVALMLGALPVAAQDKPATQSVAAELPHQLGLGLSVGAALDRGGFEIGVTARHAFTPRLLVGLTAEWCPWFDVLVRSPTVSPGSFNAYASLSFKWVGTPSVELRSVGHLGTSVLLFEPIGARVGSVGVFAGLALLSVSVRVAPSWSIEVMPDVTISVPSLSGVPFLYRQYRLLITALHWW